MNGTDAFFEEMLRSARSKARRDVSAEVKAIKIENVSLKKRLDKLKELEARGGKLSADIEKRHNKREREISAREKEVKLAVSEIRHLYKEIQKVREMTMKKFVTCSTHSYYGRMSPKAKALSKLVRNGK